MGAEVCAVRVAQRQHRHGRVDRAKPQPVAHHIRVTRREHALDGVIRLHRAPVEQPLAHPGAGNAQRRRLTAFVGRLDELDAGAGELVRPLTIKRPVLLRS
jgi:hypothetical protein